MLTSSGRVCSLLMSATGLDGHYRDLKRGLAALPPRHQLLFAASGAEVLKPNYRLFVAETGWGYVQIHEEMDPNDPALEKKILRDPLMDGELVRQRQLLQTLRTMPALDATTIEDIRQSSVALVIRWK